MENSSRARLLPVGKVLRAHGLEGGIVVRSHSGSDACFLEAGSVFLRRGNEEPREYRVIGVSPRKRGCMLRLEGVNSRDEAELYKESEVHVRKSDLSRKEGEYFWHELLGLKVYGDSGECLGRVAHILTAGGHDIYVVREGGKEILVPATQEIIKHIDLENETMSIQEIEGLIDLNEV